MRRVLMAALTGAIFAAGLALSGMTKPEKVIAFLDFGGRWDPSLAFVMGGAMLLFAPLYFWTVRRERVAFGQKLVPPISSAVDARLLVGASMFGIGWGLSGYCPGPALTSAASGASDTLWFAVAMALGMAGYPPIDRALERASARTRAAREASGELALDTAALDPEAR